MRSYILLFILSVLLFCSCEKDTSTDPDNNYNNGTNCNSVQCSGITQAGAQCQRMTTNCSARCWQHD